MSQPQVQTEIEDNNAKFVRDASAGDADALVRDFYGKDPVLLPPGAPPVHGTDAIRSFWKGMLDAGAADVRLETQSVIAHGKLAYEIGAYSFTMPDGSGGKTQVAGKYLVVCKRQQDGTLRAVADMFSSNS